VTRRALKGYRSIQAAGKIEGATPHGLTALLFEAALSSIQTARRTDDPAARHRSIDRALAIVGELQGSLRDPDQEPLSAQLYALYSFVQTQLLTANRLDSLDELQHAHDTLLPLHEAWQAIGPTAGAVPVLPGSALGQDPAAAQAGAPG